ncbi:MAG: hypothetical protein AB4062_02545 [Crocosphaera sp.]
MMISNNINSGLYEWSSSDGVPFSREELRLDVDGNFPQMVASGTGFSGLTFRIHWVARPLSVEQLSDGVRWVAPIIFKQGSSRIFPYTEVSIESRDALTRVTFSGPGLPELSRDYTFRSPFFREVQFEFDAEEGVDLTLDYQTDSHPDRPANLPAERLTIDTVFERSGFRVSRGENTTIPSSASGINSSWSNGEMHDAMQVHFSNIAELPPSQRNLPRWDLWTFFAGIHDQGTSLGGIMFDSIGAHRQGTALFVNSFISNAPFRDPAPDAWVRRMTFWTAVHEMGHAFNLLHAWQKTLGRPWLPQIEDYGLQSFMNYPFFYKESDRPRFPDRNTRNFFRDFMFRFSDDELFFLRHAPESFVQMGNADFAVNHAFEQARISPMPAFALELRTNRDGNRFEFLEPVEIELKLTNRTNQIQLVDEKLLEFTDRMTVIVQRRGGSQMAYEPYAEFCYQPQQRVLGSSESIYASLLVSVGSHSWMIDAPGIYDIKICLHLEEEDIISSPLSIRVTPPYSRDEEYLAQDFFCDAVGRAFYFNGSYCLTEANDMFAEIIERLPNRKVGIHADVTLNMPKIRNFKQLTASEKGYSIQEIPVEEKAVEHLAQTFASTLDKAKSAADTLGNIKCNSYFHNLVTALETTGKTNLELKVVQNMYSAFEARKIIDDELSKTRNLIQKIQNQKIAK